jgi:outer membrane receptor protein involved in Fe transport
MHLRSMWAVTALSCGSVLLSGTALADTEEPARRTIEEITVTAERRAASIQDTSISITAFTAQFLDDFGIRNQEDLQNFIPATTIQPYDATVRGVGRNFRALGGDPGVATYMNGIYSEDLLTATAATFWDVERIEVLRGPQGTLYGRNAVGGAINILYKEPTDTLEAALKGIGGNFGTRETYGVLSGPLVDGRLAGRLNFSLRDRDGVIDDIGHGGKDLDSLGSRNVAGQLRWTPTDTVRVNVRQNFMDNDRVFGGANGGGLVVLNEQGKPMRNTTDLVPGYRFIDVNQTDPTQRNFYDTSRPILTFTNPITGATDLAQPLRAGIDHYGAIPGVIAAPNLNGFQNAAASLTSFNFTSAEDAGRYNACVFGGTIDGDDVCAATNGLNREEFEQRGTQASVSWDVLDGVELKYLFGYNKLSYQRTTDDDGTGSLILDRQFYVNHEADYTSHEFQAFYDIRPNLSFTSGIFFYDATIDQRGDYYSAVGNRRMLEPYQDNTALSAAAAAAIGAPSLEGISASLLAFAGRPMVNLYSARDSCNVANPAPSCQRNYAVANTNESLAAQGLRNDNLQTSAWYGDDGSDPALNVKNGPNTAATDLLYATQTKRDAFAAYTQGVWDINELFALTFGARYARDKVVAEENVFRYSETGALDAAGNPGFLALYGGLTAVNVVNGGLVVDGDGNLVPTELATNGGIPFALSVYRPYERTDTKWTWRLNLDWNVRPNAMMYFSATSGYRSGGFSLVYFSTTPTYNPEELIAYEIGYKTRFLDNTLQINGSFYLYDYDTIHTFSTEVSDIGGTTTSVLEAPGAEIKGIEVEGIWLATDSLTLGGSFSYTPSKYTGDLFLNDPARADVPPSLYPDFAALTENIKGNQLLQVPERKATAWASYRFNFAGGSGLDLIANYSWIDDVYFSPFERKESMARAFDRVDLRATWNSRNGAWVVTGFVNNVFDEVGVNQIIRNGEAQFFRQSASTTTPRLFGVEVGYHLGGF